MSRIIQKDYWIQVQIPMAYQKTTIARQYLWIHGLVHEGGLTSKIKVGGGGGEARGLSQWALRQAAEAQNHIFDRWS